MPPVKILTDSTADLPPDVARRLDITVLPITIHVGKKSFRDGIDITAEDFFHQLETASIPATISAPTQRDFEKAFAELTKKSNDIVAIHASSKLSQTFRVATRAAAPLLGRSRIVVIDSQLVSVGLGMLVTKAAQAAADGATLDEVVKLVRGLIPRIYIAFFVETLEYLEKGGRVGKAQSVLGSMLSIKPLLILEDGEIVALEKVRTRAKAIEKLVEFITEFTHIEKMVVLHSNTPEDVSALIEQVNAILPNLDISIDHYGPVMATYLGPSAIGVVVYEGP
ncbi:MAG: DegV family protein [Chloroflexi bacterium]|nr:DegV family protein [Chloroflexota bacterium]